MTHSFSLYCGDVLQRIRIDCMEHLVIKRGNKVSKLRRNVKARMVKSIGWENEIMEVEYVSGLIHQYKDVSEADHIRSL